MVLCKSIVCGVTASMRSQRAASDAAVLAAETGAKLTYVHVVEIPSLSERFADRLTRAFKEAILVETGIQILVNAERIAKARGITPDKYLKKGEFTTCLRDVMEECDSDLLVLGGRTGTIFESLGFDKGNVA
jgi:nucleotide-binding universal stress UspA family protein